MVTDVFLSYEACLWSLTCDHLADVSFLDFSIFQCLPFFFLICGDEVFMHDASFSYFNFRFRAVPRTTRNLHMYVIYIYYPNYTQSIGPATFFRRFTLTIGAWRDHGVVT